MLFIALVSLDPTTFGLWAQHASPAPKCWTERHNSHHVFKILKWLHLPATIAGAYAFIRYIYARNIPFDPPNTSFFFILCELFARCHFGERFRLLRTFHISLAHWCRQVTWIHYSPAYIIKAVTRSVKKEMCSSRDRACIIANVEYGPERCVHGSMSRANDLINEEVETFL